MARREYQVAVRKTNGLEIWFSDARNIYVKHRYGITLFTRWDVRQQGFSERHWKPFRKALSYNRYIDMGYITRLATRHEISIVYVNKLPERLNEADARIMPEKGRARNNGEFNEDYHRY